MPTYDDLAAELRQRAAQLIGDAQFWIGLAGAPGSGKSTLAAALRERLGDLLTVIPMDGYHLTRSQLDRMKDPREAHARRGVHAVDGESSAHALDGRAVWMKKARQLPQTRRSPRPAIASARVPTEIEKKVERFQAMKVS